MPTTDQADPSVRTTLAMPPSQVCANCRSMAHYWGAPEVLSIELAEEPFDINTFHCVCRCRCSAVLTTTMPTALAEAQSRTPAHALTEDTPSPDYTDDQLPAKKINPLVEKESTAHVA